MPEKKVKYNFKIGRGITVLVVIAITAVLMFAGVVSFRRTTARLALDFYYPYLNMINTIEKQAAEDSLLMYSKEKLVQLSSHLMRQNSILAANAEQYHSLEDENNQLRALLKLDQFQHFYSVSAEIISRDPMTWNEQFVISRGADYGIVPGAAVVTAVPVQGGEPRTFLVGRVSEVSSHAAIVTTIRSERCQLSVSLPTSHATGNTIGKGGNSLYTHISRLPVTYNYTKNERVETSFFSELVPGGITVGYLIPFDDARVARPEHGGLYAEARFVTAIQFDKLRFVSVFVKNK